MKRQGLCHGSVMRDDGELSHGCEMAKKMKQLRERKNQKHGCGCIKKTEKED